MQPLRGSVLAAKRRIEVFARGCDGGAEHGLAGRALRHVVQVGHAWTPQQTPHAASQTEGSSCIDALGFLQEFLVLDSLFNLKSLLKPFNSGGHAFSY